MESARFAINSDDTFILDKLPTINGLLKTGLTLFVDKDFQKYRDMTLTQYAIAKRKPKTLKFMLNKLKELGIEEDDILIPKTSNTKSSLLKLAVEFGSKGVYDDVDNACLKVIIDAFKETIKKDSKYIGTPLILAIQNQNDDAIDLFMDSEANFFYPEKINDQLNLNEQDSQKTDVNSFTASSMPIVTLFKMHNDTKELENLFNGVLKKKKEQIFKQINNLTIDNQTFADFLKSHNYIEAEEFVNQNISNMIEAYRTLQQEQNSDQHQHQDSDQNPDPKPVPENHQIKCADCDEIQVNEGDFIFVPARKCYLCPKCHQKFESQS